MLNILRNLIIIIFAIYITGTAATKKYPSTLLREFLLDQDNDIRHSPESENEDHLTVSVRLNLLKIIELDALTETLNSQYYLSYNWVDPRLRWNESEYDNVDTIFLRPDEVWAPELVLDNNAKDVADNDITPQSNVVEVESNGKCHYKPRYELSQISCRSNIKWFPFDRQYCEYEFLSWKYRIKDIVFVTREESPVRLKYYTESDLWDIVDWTANGTHDHGDKSEVIFGLYLRRKPLYYVFNLIVPCFLICSLAVFAVVLQPNCAERLGFSVTVLLALSVYQIIVNDRLPTTSEVLPVIGIYFLMYTLICMLAVIMTIIVLHIYLRSEYTPVAPVPHWMSRVLCLRRSAACKDPAMTKNIQAFTSNNDLTGTVNGAIGRLNGVHNYVPKNSNRRLLVEILEHLKSMDSRQVESCEQTARDEQAANDWKRAAVVIDRIFAVCLLVCFVACTIGFIIAFAVNA